MMIVLKRTENLDARLKSIESELSHKRDVIVSENEDEAITLPLESVQQLEEFEATLQDKKTFKKMIQRFKFCEGRKITRLTNLILNKLISDELASEFSWHGKKGKKIFKENKAVKANCASCTDTEIEIAVGHWLAQASTRINRRTLPKKRNM
ncbi:hypothetical protein ABEB36_010752 [Hypothenemus hampei]|uniref:DUF4806 domain-containing protein n=1 Tax=Hypothenemus hampei TaxID=57062 RepID=A0ABD1ED97_HYPHA